MDSWFRSVWFIRILSLLLAGLLWVTVNVDNNTESDSLFFNDTPSELEVMENIPLEIRFNSEEYVVSGLPQEVSVTVEGPASTLTPVVRQKNFTVFVDLNGLGPGTHEVSLQHTGISNQLAVTLDPKTIEVTIEEKVSKNFEVNVDYINESKLNGELVLGKAKVAPARVAITGSSSVVERVASVKAIIDIEDAADSIEDREAPVKVYDNQGNELNVLVDPTTVQVSVPITKRKKQLQINVTARGGAPEGVIVSSVSSSTKEITVYGPEDVLENLEELPEIPVDITEVTEDTTVEVDVPVPDGVRAVSPEKIEVFIDVQESEEQKDEDGTT
ncbi:YbbR-like domain-containing protein [Halobacillus yeomjeoni]|uniref:YbbR family protein n=1 Tax=Halobacillus yeomjeoni TaxID=311194 RepID=A0A931HYJ7_9BACI|nr:CdaR family protein [Halobacillus yeomjeoni]MBH0231730.1 hypothetical protein [Halobacillus yeomjeoni]